MALLRHCLNQVRRADHVATTAARVPTPVLAPVVQPGLRALQTHRGLAALGTATSSRKDRSG